VTDLPGDQTIHATTEHAIGEDSGVITHPKFRMWLRPDGIVQVVWVAGATALLDDAIATVEAVARLTDGRRIPLLVDMRDTGPQDRATRAAWTARNDVSSAVGLIVGTPLSRMVGNLFIRMNKPPFPVRLFDNEASAVKWLKAYVR